jgi:hypothetical protein
MRKKSEIIDDNILKEMRYKPTENKEFSNAYEFITGFLII